MLEKLAALDAPIAASRIGNRVALANAMAEGRSVHESAPGSRAAEEIRALAREILKKAKK
jgi:chromosome partitioning protein